MFLVGVGAVVMPLMPVVVFLVGMGAGAVLLVPVTVLFVGVGAVVMPLVPVVALLVGMGVMVVVVAMLSCHSGILTSNESGSPSRTGRRRIIPLAFLLDL